MIKVLVICGPTATGKTELALETSRRFSGEIVSADSRQVYTGMDIVTGKDIPKNFTQVTSSLRWRDRFLTYHSNGDTRIWLTDIVSPQEPFNVSFWHECAVMVIADIQARGRLPIIVGGTGLYLKSLAQDLSRISVPPNPCLRQRLQGKTPDQLFDYLNKLNPQLSASLNSSDRKNPRRLIRAIEIAQSPSLPSQPHPRYQLYQLCLFAPKGVLNSRIADRVVQRLEAGAEKEAQTMISRYGFGWPSLSASGYLAFASPPPVLPKWVSLEQAYARRQITWFKKQPGLTWLDTSTPAWQDAALSRVASWYNKS